MACTYDYDTGKITLDFHLVKYDEICGLRGIKGKAGILQEEVASGSRGGHGLCRHLHYWGFRCRCNHEEFPCRLRGYTNAGFGTWLEK